MWDRQAVDNLEQINLGMCLYGGEATCWPSRLIQLLYTTFLQLLCVSVSSYVVNRTGKKASIKQATYCFKKLKMNRWDSRIERRGGEEAGRRLLGAWGCDVAGRLQLGGDAAMGRRVHLLHDSSLRMVGKRLHLAAAAASVQITSNGWDLTGDVARPALGLEYIYRKKG